MFVKKKLQSLFLILTILTSFLLLSPVYAQSTEKVIEVQNMKDLLGYIPSIEVEFKDHDETIGIWGYAVVDEEDVEGTPTWKVESTFGEEG